MVAEGLLADGSTVSFLLMGCVHSVGFLYHVCLLCMRPLARWCL